MRTRISDRSLWITATAREHPNTLTPYSPADTSNGMAVDHTDRSESSGIIVHVNPATSSRRSYTHRYGGYRPRGRSPIRSCPTRSRSA